MASSKAKKLLRKSTLLQSEMLTDLSALVKNIERGETLLNELKQDTEQMNARHQHRRTTREDIAYLEELLKCAKKKLAWEKQMETVAKRTPEVLAKVSKAMNDTANPPEPEVRATVLELLQTVQGAMSRLEAAKSAD
jgi:transketolase